MKSLLSSLFILICVLNAYSGTASCLPFLLEPISLFNNNNSDSAKMTCYDVLPQHFYNGSFSLCGEEEFSINSCSFDYKQFNNNVATYNASDLFNISDAYCFPCCSFDKSPPNYRTKNQLLVGSNPFKLAKSDFNWLLMPFVNGFVTLSFKGFYNSNTPKQEYKTNKIINHFFNKTTITHVSLNYW